MLNTPNVDIYWFLRAFYVVLDRRACVIQSLFLGFADKFVTKCDLYYNPKNPSFFLSESLPCRLQTMAFLMVRILENLYQQNFVLSDINVAIMR